MLTPECFVRTPLLKRRVKGNTVRTTTKTPHKIIIMGQKEGSEKNDSEKNEREKETKTNEERTLIYIRCRDSWRRDVRRILREGDLFCIT